MTRHRDSTPALLLREADSHDAAARACLNSYYDELDRLDMPGYDRSLVAQADSELRPPTGLMVLASVGVQTVGCGALLFPSPGVAEIKRLWVTPAARGWGVGRRLLAALEERARAAGYRQVRLETRRELADAVRLYERSGYREARPFHDVEWIHHWFVKSLP